MSKKNILVTCDISVEALAALKSQSDLDVSFSQAMQPTPEEISKAHAMLIRSGTKLHQELLNQAPNLKLVVTATSGFDHIDLEACKAKSIQVSFCPNANAESAAQLTLAMTLNALRQIPQVHQKVIQGQWRESTQRGFELTGLQLGIVGFGRIGRRVAELAKAFAMNVVTHDPYVSTDDIENLQITPMGLIELFKTSDVVSFHVPLTSETKHMLNHRTLAHFNPEAFIINASRGAVIDESELAVKMRQGLFLGAALDVFEKEPLPKESPLRELSNVIYSPHVGAHTQQAFERASKEAAEKICSFFQRQSISDLLPPNTEWAKYLI